MKIFRFLRTFKSGDRVRETRIITQNDLNAFSSLTKDFNFLHSQQKSIVHGALLNGIGKNNKSNSVKIE